LTKDLGLLFHAIHSLPTGGILKKTRLNSGFKNAYKNICKTRKTESMHEKHFVERKNEGRKPDKNSSPGRLEFMPRNLDKEMRSRIPSL
jgi:hypothetical protein